MKIKSNTMQANLRALVLLSQLSKTLYLKTCVQKADISLVILCWSLLKTNKLFQSNMIMVLINKINALNSNKFNLSSNKLFYVQYCPTNAKDEFRCKRQVVVQEFQTLWSINERKITVFCTGLKVFQLLPQGWVSEVTIC